MRSRLSQSSVAVSLIEPTVTLSRSSGPAIAPANRPAVSEEAIMPVKVEMMMIAVNIHTSAISLPGTVRGALSP